MSLETKFIVMLGDQHVEVECDLYSGNYAYVYFMYLGIHYCFPITDWQTSAFPYFRATFHDVYTDAELYGSSEICAVSAEPLSSTSTEAHDKAIMLRAIRDIFRYCAVLIKTHPTGVLDYAHWYQYTQEGTMNTSMSYMTTYGEHIQWTTCQCIIQSDFLANLGSHQVVEFPSWTNDANFCL